MAPDNSYTMSRKNPRKRMLLTVPKPDLPLRKSERTREAILDSALDELQTARSKSETLHTTIWSAVERVDRPGTSPAILSSLIFALNPPIRRDIATCLGEFD